MNRSTFQSRFDNCNIEKSFEPIVDEIMNSDAFIPPPNVISPVAWKQQRRQELLDYFTNRKLVEHLDAGYQAMIEDLEKNIPLSEVHSVKREWAHSIRKYLNEHAESDTKVENDNHATLFESMGISEDTYTLFFQSAMRYYEQQEYQKAADIFELMTFLDHRRFNVWLYKGVCDKELDNFDKAIQDFTMASATGVDSPLPHIFAAQYCIEKKEFDDASHYINLAYEIVERFPSDKQKELFAYINTLKSNIYS